MEYNSFYGGRQGASFVIQERFPFIGNEDNITKEQLEQSMIYWFKQGNGYKTVNYDEYVIIDTENKNNPNNGKVYRRGYDYNNNMGGALYVGQIVGPAGLAPHTEIKTIEEVRDIQETEEFEYRRGEGKYSVTNNSLVAGKDLNGNFNDTIEWVYCSVRDVNSSDSTAHIGFKVPYTVIDFTASIASPYTEQAEELAIRIDDTTHPFYEKWQLKVPKGIKGDAIKNLKEVTRNGDRTLVYDSYNYDTNPEGDKTEIVLGTINDIDKVEIDEDGLIKITYTTDEPYTSQLKFPYTIGYNTQTNKLTVAYTDAKNTPVDIGEPIKFIEKTEINTINYHLIITYNTGEVVDLGSVKSDNGILIGENFEDASIIDIDGWITKLNEIYSTGRDDGKIVTAGSSYDNKGFYAFNYQYNTDGKYKGWYYLGTIGSAAISAVATTENEDGSIPSLAQSLPVNGLWFVVKE